MSDKVKVLFVKDECGEIVAVFPFELGTNNPETMTCYAHVGQHSACVASWVQKQTKAAQGDFQALHNELVNVFEYDLQIIHYFPDVVSFRSRRKQLEKMKSG